MPDVASSRAYLSIIAWPEGSSRQDNLRLVADHLPAPGASTLRPALAIHDVGLRIAIPAPVILGVTDTGAAESICRAVRAAGGDAFAPTEPELLSFGATLKVRDLEIEEGNLRVTIWRGPEATIAPAAITSLIRAHLSESVRVRTPERARISQAYYLAGSPALMRSSFLRDTTSTKLQTSDKLDIHTAGGAVFQIDGDKFGYRALGAMKQYSDKANMDRMFELLQHLAPNAVPDMFFPLFKPPPGFDRLKIPGAALNRDDPAFAFYSRWAALMYRHVLGTG